MADAPRITHYVVADDTRARYLVIEASGVARWVQDVERADKFPDFELARQTRDAIKSGYIAVPVVAAPENMHG